MIQKILSDQFVRNNIILFAGSMIAAIFNYAYHPIMSRVLSVSDFGEMQALISLTYIIGIFLAVFGTVAVNVIANNDQSMAIKKVNGLFSFVLPIVIAFTGVIVIFSPFLQDIFHFTSIISFFPLIFILSVDVFNTFYGAFVRGTKKFTTLSIMAIISSVSRILFGVLFVLMGMRVFGAIGAFAMATLLSLLYARHRVRGEFALEYLRNEKKIELIKEEWNYALLVTCSIGFVTFLYSSDVLFAKYYFDPEAAGLYSGISMIARSIFFATGSVAAVLLPSVIIRVRRRNNRIILLKAIIINGAISISAMLLFILLPHMTIVIMLGEKYVAFKDILAYAGVSAILISIVNIVYTYYLALRDQRLVYSSIIGVTVICILMIINHDSPHAILTNYYITSISVLGFLGFYKYLYNDKQKKLN